MIRYFLQLVWVLIAALMVYGGWQLLAALRANRALRSAFDKDDAVAAANDSGDTASTAEAPPESAAPAETGVDAFALELELQYLKRGLADLRKALDTQQEEIKALHVTVTALATRPASAEETAFDASPEYIEAQALARRGVPTAEIVQRCGITLAEAELLVSMASGRRTG
ncbi:MAG: DUF2802 domain-containing protein [Azoarcus sp.]|jgi:hypothetical protein|nr:DUF2802 domain-containing protein [Azoarcus sp.]